MIPVQHSINSDWLFNFLLSILLGDWLISENEEKATLNIKMGLFIPLLYLLLSTF